MLAIFDGTAAPVPTAAEAGRYQEDIRSHGIQAVIVGPMPHQDVMIQLFIAIIGRRPQAVDGVYVWQDVGSNR